MKYLLKYNEGLFASNDANEVVNKILITLNLLHPEVIFIENNNSVSYILTNLKLDDNPGTYKLYLNIKDKDINIILEYYKNNTLLYTQEIDCNNNLKLKLYDMVLSKYTEE